MAKKRGLNVVGIKASSLAMFEGTLAGLVGFAVAVLYSLNTTVQLAEQTNSVLRGLAFGVGTGIVSIIVLPLIYFGIGWLVGYLHGWIFNVVVGQSGGIELSVED